MLILSSEYSSQPNRAKPNPMLRKAIEYLINQERLNDKLRVADQGCGALRHLTVLLEFFNEIYLIDTKAQCQRKHTLNGTRATLSEYLEGINFPNKKFSLIDNEEFSSSKLALDIVFNLCTFDVVLANTRKEILESAKRNLSNAGLFVLIIPRNDSSILRRCTVDNRFEDGHTFSHHGINTFFKNFRNCDEILTLANEHGFTLYKDMSNYRQACLILSSERL